MTTPFKAIPISKKVYWVGAIDWGLREFHGYSTSRGTTYNAYLVLADRVTLIDTVKKPFEHELMARISSVINPSEIDYIVSNHSEMDHSGSLPSVVGKIRPERVFASKMGVKALSAHFESTDWLESVDNEGSLSLGDMTLNFLETRMLHWPDSMVSYLEDERVLFSQDAFGMHLATSRLFVDENEWDIVRYETAKYYANILLPYSQIIPKALERITGMGWDINVIAGDHGPLWRRDISVILDLYAHWAAQKPTNKAVIVYDTMWRSTELMAHALADGIQEGGGIPVVLPLSSVSRSDVATEILEAGALLLGSPTINNNIFPSLADTLTYLRGLKPKNLIGAAFGSYGWSGEAQKQLENYLQEMNVEVVADPIKVNYVPTSEDLNACRNLGITVAEKLSS